MEPVVSAKKEPKSYMVVSLLKVFRKEEKGNFRTQEITKNQEIEKPKERVNSVYNSSHIEPELPTTTD